MPAERRGTGELEAEVLAALWSVEPDPATPSDVQAALGSDLAYTTVMTILSRLWKKGLVERERQGRAYAYRPLLSEAELAARRMQAQLDRTKDREAALSRFVDALPKRDERVLRRIIHKLE
ncbi:MAG: BlaI/MecI/CopY family transcriptional regulator [Acidimicrobiia bacterium]|nr:BlaI/MecI/CopY family transcriptional regulator [Acidimicrobiia bacterium]